MCEKDRQELVSHLEALSEVDIRSVGPEELVDIADITIKNDLPQPERIRDYIQQIKNPYCFLSHGIVIKISFSGKKRFEDCLKDAMTV